MKRADGDSVVGTTADVLRDRLSFEVPASPEQVATARHVVVDFLSGRGVPSVMVDDMELVTSELVTNAIIHPEATSGRVGTVAVDVELNDAVVLLVSNVGPAGAIPPVDSWQPAPPLAASGRGLGIVRRLCDVVSVEQDGDRAVVRCRRRLPDGGGSG